MKLSKICKALAVLRKLKAVTSDEKFENILRTIFCIILGL